MEELIAGGDNEVQRTMLEIVNQLDGFDSRGNIKVRLSAYQGCFCHSSATSPDCGRPTRQHKSMRICRVMVRCTLLCRHLQWKMSQLLVD